MFERFTDRARRCIVLAQEEARRLHHDYIGTEHILLGLLAEETGLAAKAAERFGLTLAVGRDDVIAIIGRGKRERLSGHIPFTPRAKKCLELALREALQLGHDYIGTEHILLGIVREGNGVAAQILIKHAGSLTEVRQAVIDLLPAEAGETQRAGLLRRLAGRRTTAIQLQPEPPELRTTPAADTSLAEAARLAGAGALGSHHILLAALADPNTAAARALVSLGVDLDRARDALRTADVTGSSDELPEEAGRRQMLIAVTDHVTLEATDPEIVQLARAAAEGLRSTSGAASPHGESAAVGDPGDTSGAAEPVSSGSHLVIRGDHPLSGSLALVWQALHDSLEDIRNRSAAEARDAAARAAGETPAAGGTPGKGETPAAGESPAGPAGEVATGD